jgi:diguanylate cyclase (GGDEF)-like protein
MLGRLGGDEFVVLLPNADDRQAVHCAHKVLDALAAPFGLLGAQTLAASIGVALAPDDGDNAEVLVQRADWAMYHAKRDVHHRVARYRTGMQPHALP